MKIYLTEMEVYGKVFAGPNIVAPSFEKAEQAAKRIDSGETEIALRPQNSYLRRIQHQIADDHGLESSSQGQEPSRRVIISGNN